MKAKLRSYAVIHFENRKPIKKQYDTASNAFYDYEDQSCVLVELFNGNGILLSSIKK